MTARLRKEFVRAITPLANEVWQASHETFDLIDRSPGVWYVDTTNNLVVEYPPVLSDKERLRARVEAAAWKAGSGWYTEGIETITEMLLRAEEEERDRAWRAAKAQGEWELERFWVVRDMHDIERRERLEARRQKERELVSAGWNLATNATKRMSQIATKHLRQAYLAGMRYSEIVMGLQQKQQNPPQSPAVTAVTKGLSLKIQATAKSKDFQPDGHGINETVFDLITDMIFRTDSLTDIELKNPNAIRDLAHSFYIAAFNYGVVSRFGDRVNYRFIAPIGCCPICAAVDGLVFSYDSVKDRIKPNPMRIGCLGVGIWQPTFDLESSDSVSEEGIQ